MGTNPGNDLKLQKEKPDMCSPLLSLSSKI